MNSGGRRIAGALVGPGRSGTTWAATLIDSSPEVIYRFEPFHRMSLVSGEYREWIGRLKRQQVLQEDLPRLYELLSRAHPLTDKQPFFPKQYQQFTLGRRQVWPLARVFPPAARAYEAMYSPSPGAPVVFKEVTFIRPLRNLLEKTDVPVVYLVRHPCATVLSEVHGQREGMMPSGRQQRLNEVLRQHAPELAERFGGVCAGSDLVRRVALLWRCEVELCLRLLDHSPHSMLMTYEQLADDAYLNTRSMLEHFGLAYTEQTTRYIAALYGLKQSTARKRRTGWGDSYYSVLRNPREQKDAWKSRISAEDRRKVEQIVGDSTAVARCAAQGAWS